MRVLSKDPEDRPVDADAFAAELAECSVANEWTKQHARAWWQEHPFPELEGSRVKSSLQNLSVVNVTEELNMMK